MDIIAGNMYFIEDSFFDLINDPYLKKDYSQTKRPHYYAFRDIKTSLYWLVPCSSKVEKFEKIIESKRARHRRTDTIQIVTILDKKAVLLFQDMFPVTEKYIRSSISRADKP